MVLTVKHGARLVNQGDTAMQTINHNDKTLTLVQQPYISDCGAFYQAHAKDDDDNTYLVKWAVTNDDPDNCDDESDMCDWDVYTVSEI
jgi:hypothetical protein